MYADIRAGLRDQYDARDYYHNIIIDKLFQAARKRAWAKLSADPRAMELMEKELDQKRRKVQKKTETANILNIYK